MSAVWTAVTTFLQNILILIGGGTIGTGSDAVTIDGIVGWIAGNPVAAVFICAIPLVSVAVGFLSRMIHRTFR